MTEIHPRHEDARRAMADRLSHFLYDNHQPSFLVEKAGERYWTEFVVGQAREKRVPSEATRVLVVELLKDLEDADAPRGVSLEEIAGGRDASSWGTPPPDTVSGGPYPTPSQEAPRTSGPSDSSEAPAAGTRGNGEGAKGDHTPTSSPLAASEDVCPPAGIGLSESPRGGQVSLLPPFQKHSETSVSAARSIAHETAAMRLRVLQFLRDNPNCTDEEIAEGTGLPPNTARPRRVELMQSGQIVQTGKKVARSGRKAATWGFPTLRSVCAWCDSVLVEGDAPTPVSHGICPACVLKQEAAS